MPLPRRGERANLPNVATLLEFSQQTILGIQRDVQGNNIHSREALNDAIRRLDSLSENIGRVSHLFRPRQIAAVLHESLTRLRESLLSHSVPHRQRYRVQRVTYEGRISAPRYDIDQQVMFLTRHGFSAVSIAGILRPVSVRTIRRRLAALRRRRCDRFSQIPQNDLESTVEYMHGNFPRAGFVTMQSLLSQSGIRVPRERVRRAMRRVDPVGVAVRWSNAIRRRRYQVNCPNAVWHLDANHALIRWRFVVSGCIDGYSRVITHLHVANNLDARTTLQFFLSGIRRFGTPSRVRCDHGAENRMVAQFMLMARGINRASVMTGRSVHNQRIERLWVDVFARCLHVYYELFQEMEVRSILDPGNEDHLFALHYVFLPRIQNNLTTFAHSWNNHSIRTENHRTPMQLWIQGSVENFNANLTAMHSIFRSNPANETETRHTGQNNMIDVQPNNPVTIPQIITHGISDEFLAELRRTIDPLGQSQHHGVDIYGSTLQILWEFREQNL